jgi:hypothetical protein
MGPGHQDQGRRKVVESEALVLGSRWVAVRGTRYPPKRRHGQRVAGKTGHVDHCRKLTVQGFELSSCDPSITCCYLSAIRVERAVLETYEEWRELALTVLQKPTDMDFGFTFVMEDPDEHRLRPFVLAANPR